MRDRSIAPSDPRLLTIAGRACAWFAIISPVLAAYTLPILANRVTGAQQAVVDLLCSGFSIQPGPRPSTVTAGRWLSVLGASMTTMQQIAIDPNAPHRRIIFDAIDDQDDRAARFAERTGWTLRAANDSSVLPLTGRPPTTESPAQADH